MSFQAQRFVSPILVDLGMEPSSTTTVSVDMDADLAHLLPDADSLLKCELDSVFDVSTHLHASPLAVDAALADMELDLEPLPLVNATVATPTIARSSRASSSASSERRGGRSSQFTAKQRRERHNANERRRTNAAKDRVKGMRDEVESLEARREQLATSGDVSHLRAVEEMVDEAARQGQLGDHIPGAVTYLDLVKTVDHLRDEKRYLEDQLDVLDSQNSVLQAMQCELTLSGDVVASLKRKREDEVADESSKRAKSSSPKNAKKDDVKKEDEVVKAEEQPEDNEDEEEEEGELIAHPRGGYCAETEAVPAYLCALFPSPMSSAAAFDWVKQSYAEIMAQHAARHEVAPTEDSSFFGWEAHRLEASKSLEYLLSTSLAGVASSDLVFRSWRQLSTLEGFRSLFPSAKDLAVLQTVNDDCLVLRVGWTSSADGKDCQSLVVLARGQIDGGYLISARSIPLSAGKRAFAREEGEGRFVELLGWLMLMDSVDGCEATLGGRMEALGESKTALATAMRSAIVAGAVRWQQAVGCGGGARLLL